jgi:pimeloyl-ACP methyl ester carboxylesterase
MHDTEFRTLPSFDTMPVDVSCTTSTKPRAILNYCQEHTYEFTTFDYSCHGESSCSNPQESFISRWIQEALRILEEMTTNPRQILVGSSMGAWIMVLLAQSKRTNRTSSPNIVGLVGIAFFYSPVTSVGRRTESMASILQTVLYYTYVQTLCQFLRPCSP